MKLQWDESLSIDNEEIDKQHKQWIDFYNKLDDVMLSDNSEDVSSTKAEILQQMSDYVEYHFRYEEEFMRKIDFPDADRHWRMHKNFRNDIYRVCRDHEEGIVVLNSEIMDMIKNWLLEHIVQQDMKVKQFLMEKNSAER